MFNKEIEFITDLNSTKLRNYSGSLSLSNIKKSTIHKAILKYVLAEIEQQLFLDKYELIKNSIFEYNDDRINNYLNLISENIKRTNKFKIEYLSKLVHDSVSFNIHFLIAPNKTLTQFVFGNTNNKSVNEINFSLSHIYYYKYFRKIISAYFKKKNVTSISRSDFIILLKKIDAISNKSHLSEIINTAINSMADFFKVAIPNEIPTQAIYLFLQGKKLTTHCKIIQSEFIDKQIATISNTQIKNILNSLRTKEDKLNQLEQNHLNPNKKTEESADILNVEENEQPISNEELLSSEAEIKKEDRTIIHEEDKPNAMATISSLINIDDLFDSILSEEKNYSKEKVKITDPKIFIENISTKINFKFEESTLEEFLINENFISDNESELTQFQSIYEAEPELNGSSIKEEDFFIEENIDEITQLKETDEKIKEVDEYISEIKIEEPITCKIEETTVTKKTNTNFNTTQNIEEDITLSENNDEEMTEVFSDLTYLNKNEIEEDEIEELQKNEITNINEEKFEDLTIEDEDIETDHNNNKILTETNVLSDTKTFTSQLTFKEIIAKENMSQAIEIIFDYDMEDYQKILNKISENSTEKGAIKIVDDYCSQNYITTTYPEVKNFKELISKYYNQKQI